MQLTELGRRVLGHLPVWAEDEEAHVAAEGGPDRIDEETGQRVGSIRCYDLPAFTQRLAEDQFTVVGDGRSLTEEECKVTLDALVAQGLASVDADGYRMTQAGLEAIVAPEGKPDQVPGAVVVDLAPATATSDAMIGA